jgi:hypothetical protein
VKGSPSPFLLSVMWCTVAYWAFRAPGPAPSRPQELHPCSPERRPTRRRHWSSPPLLHPRPWAFLKHLCVVSKTFPLLFLFLAHNIDPTSLPARAIYPLPAPAAVDARASSLTP